MGMWKKVEVTMDAGRIDHPTIKKVTVLTVLQHPSATSGLISGAPAEHPIGDPLLG
jgi:hypothetical protein